MYEKSGKLFSEQIYNLKKNEICVQLSRLWLRFFLLGGNEQDHGNRLRRVRRRAAQDGSQQRHRELFQVLLFWATAKKKLQFCTFSICFLGTPKINSTYPGKALLAPALIDQRSIVHLLVY